MRETLIGVIVGALLTGLSSLYVVNYQNRKQQIKSVYFELIYKYSDPTKVYQESKNSNRIYWYQISGLAAELRDIERYNA